MRTYKQTKTAIALRELVLARGFRGFQSFGVAIGVDRNTLTVACGGRALQPRTAETIARGLGITVDDLVRLGLHVRPRAHEPIVGLLEALEGGGVS